MALFNISGTSIAEEKKWFTGMKKNTNEMQHIKQCLEFTNVLFAADRVNQESDF